MNKNTEIIIDRIKKEAEGKKLFIAAVDGRCASGKTTLAENIRREIDCNVFHMDDFFLRPEQRTNERLDTPGGNVDRERFYSEIMTGLLSGSDFSYRPYSCETGTLMPSVNVTAKKINIIEGAYSCHPQLSEYYDLKIFLSVTPKRQFDRIVARNGREEAKVFKNRWIPLEEKYFAAFDISGSCHMVIET